MKGFFNIQGPRDKSKGRIVFILLTLLLFSAVMFSTVMYVFANGSREKADVSPNLLLGTSGGEDKNLGTDDEKVDLGLSGENKVTLGASVASAPRVGSNAPESIGGLIPAHEKNKIIIVPGTDGSPYQAFDPAVFGGAEGAMREAVFALYTVNDQLDYVLYVGEGVHLEQLGQYPFPANPVKDDVVFGNLKGRIGTLFVTGSFSDPLFSSRPEADKYYPPADAKSISSNSGTSPGIVTGTNIHFRNITTQFDNLFTAGGDLTYGYGAVTMFSTNIYGGIPDVSQDFVGDTVINMYSGVPSSRGGSDKVSIYGTGFEQTKTGTVTINIHDMVNGLSKVSVYNIVAGTSATKQLVTGDVTINIATITGRMSALSLGNKYAKVVGNGSLTVGVSDGGPENLAFTSVLGEGGGWVGNINAQIDSLFTGSQPAEMTSIVFAPQGGGYLAAEQSAFTGVGTVNIGRIGTNVGFISSGSSVGFMEGDVDFTIGEVTGTVKRMSVVGALATGLDTTVKQFKGNYRLKVDKITGTVTDLFPGTQNSNLEGSTTLELGSIGLITNFNPATKDKEITGDVNVSIIGKYLGTVNQTYTNFTPGTESGKIGGDVTFILAEEPNGNFGRNITNFYGGGVGTAAKNVSIGGIVTTEITRMSGSLGAYYGGVAYGDIGGGVVNKFSGPNKWLNLVSKFIAGSKQGNIGTENVTVKAITTDFDTSKFTYGRSIFTGANEEIGFIYGDIDTKITAGLKPNIGGVYSISGGAAISSVQYHPALTVAGGNEKTSPETVQALYIRPVNPAAPASGGSQFRVYGNISTEVTQGSVGAGADNGWTRAAGWAGYIKGDVTLHMGTQGLAFPDDRGAEIMTQSTTSNARGYGTAYDIVGGGGATGTGYKGIFLEGNTNLIFENILARWTYGGGFSGYIWGNTNIELRNGIVDTLEGAGFEGEYIWGNSKATIVNGQVDWFLSGGGWNDHYIVGDVSVLGIGGTVNATIGGTYGSAVRHTVTGDSHILVKGGDYSGVARYVPYQGFSGGPSYAGYILGNSTVTLDLRSTTGFMLPVGTYISAGLRYDAGGAAYLGTGNTTTSELNIFTKSGSDILKGAIIYGDGGTTVGNSSMGKITINIDAPDSSIGEIFATQYANVAATSIVKDIEYNVYDAKSIESIYGGRKADVFSNSNATSTTNPNRSVMNFINMDGGVKTIQVGAGGIVNFTQLNLDGMVLAANLGHIINSSGATAINHGATHSLYGDINLKNKSGFGISSGAIVSGATLTVDGDGSLTSPSGGNTVNITDFKPINNGKLHWTKTGTAAYESGTGTWFGPQTKLYRVLTFTPTRANALSVTPNTLIGTDTTGKKLFIGDNDVVTQTSGHGVVVSGTRWDYKVVAGLGGISHNILGAHVGDTPPGTPIKALSSHAAGDPKVQSGWIIIPEDNYAATSPKPALTFSPETTSGSWVKQIAIDQAGVISTIGEQDDSMPYEWSPAVFANEGYKLDATFTDEVELTAQNAVITESQALAITSKTDVITYNQAAGRPYYGDNIDATKLGEIRQPLGSDKYRVHDIEYTAGKGISKMTQNVKLFVVPNDAIISPGPNPTYALWAKSATMLLQEATALTGQGELDSKFTYAFSIDVAGGILTTPTANPAHISAIQAATGPVKLPVGYMYQGLSKEVEITIVPGKPEFPSIPSNLQFGTHKTTPDSVMYPHTNLVTVSVKDERPVGTPFKISLKSKDLVLTGGLGSGLIPANKLVYKEGSSVYPLNIGHEVASSVSDPANITQTFTWPANSTGDGIFFSTGGGMYPEGQYEGTIVWSIEYTP